MNCYVYLVLSRSVCIVSVTRCCVETADIRGVVSEVGLAVFATYVTDEGI